MSNFTERIRMQTQNIFTFLVTPNPWFTEQNLITPREKKVITIFASHPVKQQPQLHPFIDYHGREEDEEEAKKTRKIGQGNDKFSFYWDLQN